MLKYCDSFDHITASSLTSLGWWGLDWWNGNLLAINQGLGRWGTNRLELVGGSGNPKTFTLARSCNRIVVGFAFSKYANNSTHTLIFSYGTYKNFSVTFALSASGLTFSFATGAGTGYPAIPSSAYVSVPFIQSTAAYTFVEVLVDVTDYTNGQVKCAINGKVVHNVTGIKTAAGDGFGNNPYDPRAKINTIMFATDGAGNYGTGMYIDCIYICDDEGGYHNDFLGDIFVKALYPTNDGDRRDWSPYINGLLAPDDTQRVTLIDDPVFDPAIEPDFIQADQELSQELMHFHDAGIPVDSTLIALNHRTVARSLASPGSPQPNTLIPIFKSSGNDIITISSLAKKLAGWTYQFLDVYHNLVPGLAIDWTPLLLEESQFGFVLREPIWTGLELEEITFAEEVTEAHIPEVTDSPLDFADEVVDE